MVISSHKCKIPYSIFINYLNDKKIALLLHEYVIKQFLIAELKYIFDSKNSTYNFYKKWPNIATIYLFIAIFIFLDNYNTIYFLIFSIILTIIISIKLYKYVFSYILNELRTKEKFYNHCVKTGLIGFEFEDNLLEKEIKQYCNFDNPSALDISGYANIDYFNNNINLIKLFSCVNSGLYLMVAFTCTVIFYHVFVIFLKNV